MEEVNDIDLKRERLATYGHAPPAPHRMPPTETPASHSYHPPPPGSAVQHSWQPAPSPYETGEHRPPSSDVAAHTPYPPHSYPPHAREPAPPPGYGAEHAYSRPGSISAPTRSPAEAQHPHFQAVNGTPHEARYYQGPISSEYRHPHSYGPPESPANGTQTPHGLQLVTAGPEMMSGPPPGQPAYGPPSAGAHPYPPQYYGDPYPRRKPVRATQACDSCRQRKAKCDEGRPDCQHCKDNNLKCSYREVPPQKQEKHVLALNEKLESIDQRFYQGQDDVKKLFERQEEKINRMMDLMQNIAANDNRSNQQSVRNDGPPPSGTRLKRETSQPGGSNQTEMNQSFSSTQGQNQADPAADEDKAPSQDFALPPNHYTAAQNLLQWPSIRALVPATLKESYVMDLESSRGLLRLYGCGEGEDKNDGGEGAASPVPSSTSSGRMEDEISTPSPGGVWGSGVMFPPSPAQTVSAQEHAGGVNAHGGLILDAAVVDRYHTSYMDNMHILHPFLESRVLRDMVSLFKRRYSRDVWQQKLSNVTGKRKREHDNSSPGVRLEYPHHSIKPSTRHPSTVVPVEHSIANAIVLLVIALGKICAHKQPLPGAPSPSAMLTSTPQSTYTDFPMSISAPTSPYQQGIAKSEAPMPAISGPSNPQGKNMDVIPGLAYFAKAADILGELPGGNDVSHVQANLLAGLFMGQLARVFASHFYISTACRACMVLIDSSDYKRNNMRPARRNLINFAFWSCLQLESDILAEVELPPSGITRYEWRMRGEMPSGITLERELNPGSHQQVLRFYSQQIQLRRTLNDIHTALYQQQTTQPAWSQQRPSMFLINACNDNLEGWRRMLNDWDWNEDDHKASDINVARMRAKYYGAKYIIHRPALYYALSLSSASTPRERPSESPVGQGSNSRFPSPSQQHSQSVSRSGRAGGGMGPPSKQNDHMDHNLMKASRTCIAAAIRSTTAFDGVANRLIITNIFGTAHAQFGNMLVLAATYSSTNPELKALVDERTMRGLLDRTINFLKLSENISPVLKHDAGVLDNVKTKLFSEPGSASNSFTGS